VTLPRSIAVAQTCPVQGDVTANLAEHLGLAQLAAAAGAQVVVFPELSLTGYEIGLADTLAIPERDPRLAPLADAAASLAMTLIAGAPVRIGTRLHIASLIFYPDRTTTLYTKRHLGAFPESARRDGSVPPAESTVFQPGDRDPLVRFAGHDAALAICADVGRPSHPRQAAARGARTYLASMFVIPSEFEADASRLAGYAKQYSMVAALANFGSPTGRLAAAGRSSIWSEKGELLARLAPGGAGIAVASETPGGWRTRTTVLDGGRPR
jgi:predicted amidohydrolase